MKKYKISFPFSLIVLFNGGSGIIALGFLIFGLASSGNLRATFDLPAMLYLNGDVRLGDGKIIDIFETSESNDEDPIMGYEYIFYSPIGELTWTSYSSYYNYLIGDEVQVEYHPERPYIHRIEGMNNTLGIPFLIIILMSSVLLLYNLLVGLRKVLIIRYGLFTHAQLVSQKETTFRYNDRTIHKMKFTFQTENGRTCQITKRTRRPEKLDQNSPVIYMKSFPKWAVLLDALPMNAGKALKER